MNKCEELLKNHERKTIGYLTNSGAYDAGFRVGFKNALNWVLDEFPEFQKLHISMIPDLFEKIEKELSE